MRRVAEECGARFFRYPRRKWISIYQLPIYKLAFWCFADDRTTGGIPIFYHLQHVLDFPGKRPRFIDVRFILSINNCVILSAPYE
jgi:hypothetical protein